MKSLKTNNFAGEDLIQLETIINDKINSSTFEPFKILPAHGEIVLVKHWTNRWMRARIRHHLFNDNGICTGVQVSLFQCNAGMYIIYISNIFRQAFCSKCLTLFSTYDTCHMSYWHVSSEPNLTYLLQIFTVDRGEIIDVAIDNIRHIRAEYLHLPFQVSFF